MAYGSAFGIRKILICGAGICYLVILRGEGGIAKKVTALWFILFGPGRFPVLQRERTRDCLMLYGTRSCFHRVYPERNLGQRCFKRCLQRLKQTLDIVRNKKKKETDRETFREHHTRVLFLLLEFFSGTLRVLAGINASD